MACCSPKSTALGCSDPNLLQTAVARVAAAAAAEVVILSIWISVVDEDRRACMTLDGPAGGSIILTGLASRDQVTTKSRACSGGGTPPAKDVYRSTTSHGTTTAA